jgi:Uma2 family endonuclease
MVLHIEHLPVDEFDRFVLLPENADKLFEYIGGEIVEVVANNYSSEVAALILMFIGLFVRQNDLGRVTGADGGYHVSGERYIPDVAFIAKIRQPEPSREAYNPNPPDLAIEVLSPSNSEDDMRIKLVNYLRAGTTVWIVNCDKKQVEIYSPSPIQAPKTLDIDGTIDGGDVLPGFKLAVKDIFPD